MINLIIFKDNINKNYIQYNNYNHYNTIQKNKII